MDLTNENNFGEVSPLPKNDYNADGKVKTIRSRMVKKLLRYEFKAHFQMLIPYYIVLFILATSIVCMANISRAVNGNFGIITFLVITLLCFFIMAFIVLLSPIATCAERIRKNFFGKEGYLTLSTPVSAEEHLLAKHLSAFVCLILSTIVCLLMALYLFYAGGVAKSVIGDVVFEPITMTVNNFFLGLEEFINYIIGSMEIIVIFGAVTCFLQKCSKKKRVFIIIAAIFGFNIISQVFVALLVSGNGIFEFFTTTVAGQHISNLLQTIFSLAVIVGCVYYELRRIKYNINLE